MGNATKTAKAVEVDSMILHHSLERAKHEAKADQFAKMAAYGYASESSKAKYRESAEQHERSAKAAGVELAKWAAQYMGWNRFYLVVSSQGHVHSSTHCSSCFDTTAFAWLTEYSGMGYPELVELAGERACTVCFPDAPVTDRESMLAPDVKSREEKAAAAAAREAKRNAADAAKVVVGRQVFKTVRGAENEVGRLVDNVVGRRYMDAADAEHRAHLNNLAAEDEAEAREIVAALVAQHGVDGEALLAKKFAAKVKEHKGYGHYTIPDDATF